MPQRTGDRPRGTSKGQAERRFATRIMRTVDAGSADVAAGVRRGAGPVCAASTRTPCSTSSRRGTPICSRRSGGSSTPAGPTTRCASRSRSPRSGWPQALDEGLGWFDKALAAEGARTSFAATPIPGGLLAFWPGYDERSAELHGQALAIGRRTGDPTITAPALTGLARLALRSGNASDIKEARWLCREALTITEGIQDGAGPLERACTSSRSRPRWPATSRRPGR
jgi:hypothetical protein